MSDRKGKVVNKFLGKHPSGAEAAVNSAGVSARLKSGPETRQDLPSLEAQSAAPMSLAEVRRELQGTKGKKYWRSVDELADTPEFQAAVRAGVSEQRRNGWIRFRVAAS